MKKKKDTCSLRADRAEGTEGETKGEVVMLSWQTKITPEQTGDTGDGLLNAA